MLTTIAALLLAVPPPQAPRPPQAPEPPIGFVQPASPAVKPNGCGCNADCPLHGACTDGQSCGGAACRFTKPAPKAGGYYVMLALAIAEDRPLVVFLGAKSFPVRGCLTLEAVLGTYPFEAFKTPQVMVMVPGGGKVDRIDLPGTATVADVQAAVRNNYFGGTNAHLGAPAALPFVPASSAPPAGAATGVAWPNWQPSASFAPPSAGWHAGGQGGFGGGTSCRT